MNNKDYIPQKTFLSGSLQTLKGMLRNMKKIEKKPSVYSQ